jgi:glycosyltransferase involved in cell wall biosynthesis
MENRSPDAVFDEETYLADNPDVREAVEAGKVSNGMDHWYIYGAGEGKSPFWKVIGQDRGHQCDAVLIEGLVDIPEQFWSCQGQQKVHFNYYIISSDPDKYEMLKKVPNIVYISTKSSPVHLVVHDLIPKLTSDYILFSMPCLQGADYVRSQINRMENSGREVLLRVGFEFGNTVIVRKNSLLDMGGFRDTAYYYLEDMIQRAKAEERPIDLGETLRSASGDFPSERVESLRHHAIGYPKPWVSCDVVIPFYDQLSFVQESVDSIVRQDGADVVLHIIDDCSRENTEDVFKEWRKHPNVRVYRNIRNIGQFMSVNNVVQFLETDYLALLDGDDISDPRRIWDGVNLLNLTRADLFSSRIKMFGDEYEWNLTGVARKVWMKRSDRHWNCTYPHEYGYHYFPNTALIMTKKSFVDLGGFTDFADVVLNKTANDTDLLYRYYYSGYGTCYSVSNLVHVRRHENSCTQNIETGWASPNRKWAHNEVERRRRQFYRDRKFNPQSFGGIGSSEWEGVTQPV